MADSKGGEQGSQFTAFAGVLQLILRMAIEKHRSCRGQLKNHSRAAGQEKPENFAIRVAIRFIWFYNEIMLTVIETDEFLAWYKQVWSDEERDAFVNWIAERPEAGNVIPHTGGLRKVRFARQGMGKQGGARVIYYLCKPDGQIVLLLVYAKAKYDNLRPEFLRKLKEKYDV